MPKITYHLPDRPGSGRPRRLHTDSEYREDLISKSGDMTLDELADHFKMHRSTIARDLAYLITGSNKKYGKLSIKKDQKEA